MARYRGVLLIEGNSNTKAYGEIEVQQSKIRSVVPFTPESHDISDVPMKGSAALRFTVSQNWKLYLILKRKAVTANPSREILFVIGRHLAAFFEKPPGVARFEY